MSKAPSNNEPNERWDLCERFVSFTIFLIVFFVAVDVAGGLGASFLLSFIFGLIVAVGCEWFLVRTARRLRDQKQAKRDELTDEERHAMLSEIAARVKAERLKRENGPGPW